VVLDALVIKPMKKIRAGVTALGRQEFHHRVDLRTGDEFQDLGETLNGISEQLNAAQVIQESFFPKEMPHLTFCRVAGDSIPCDATGGDYFDAFELEDGRLAVLLADVSGHGLGPSLLMATCRSALRAMSRLDLSPAELVRRLNDLLLADLTDGRFITLVYGVLDADGRFTYANAGHGPALVVRGGTTEHLPSHRPPLGIDIDLDDEPQTTVTLAAGDRILFTSDGLSEAMDGTGSYYGLEPIERAAADAAATCDEIVERLKAELLAHCGGPSKSDDVTVVCVDRV
jgi:serine phosphatase RsbU (regulator of sigma subunit)